MNVRVGQAHDLARILIIERAAASLYAPFGLEQGLREGVTPERRLMRAVREGELFVATDALDRAVGFALFGSEGDDVHLEELAVIPSHGRHGLGARLVERVAAAGQALGASRLTLVTLDFLPFVKAFYLSRGFVRLAPAQIPRFMHRLIDPDVDDGRIALARSLR